MSRGVVFDLAYRVAACATVIMLLELSLGKGGLLSGFLHIDLSALLRPLQYLCILLFVSSVLKLVLAGELAAPLASSVRILAFGLFFFMLFGQHPFLFPLGSWAFACSAIAAFKKTGDAILFSYHIGHLKPLTTSISIFLGGYFSSTMLHTFSGYFTFTPFSSIDTVIFYSSIFVSALSSIDTVIFYSSIFVSALSLLGLLSSSRNPYASYLGRVFAEAWNIFGFFLLFTLIQIYFFNLRPVLLKVFPWYVSPLEWAAVCIAAFAAFMRVKSYVSRVLSEQLRFGEWKKHIQKIVYEKGDLEGASEAVSQFVEEGVKEGVIVYLTSMLLRNSVPFSEVERVVGSIVGYEDIPPPRLTLAFSLESLREMNRMRRMEVLTSALREAASILHLPSQLVNVGGELSENREV